MRWVWLDKFISIERGKRSVATRHFSLEEDCLEGHFPQYPVVPNPLLLEAMTQTGGVLVGAGLDFKREVVLAKVPKAKFFKDALPPVDLRFEAELKELRDEIAFVDACIKQDGNLTAEATIIFACLERLLPDRDEKVVFTPQFLQAFKVYEIIK